MYSGLADSLIEYINYSQVLFKDALEVYTRMAQLNKEKVSLRVITRDHAQCRTIAYPQVDKLLLRDSQTPRPEEDRDKCGNPFVGPRLRPWECPSCYYKVSTPRNSANGKSA